MISNIKLLNFQSHSNTELEFCPGVNTFIGQSNAGKSSILRALLWVITNRPVGDAFVSHWNRDDKGNIKDTTSVQVETNNRIVKRKKEKSFNGYVVDDEKEFEAIKTDVPPEIEKIFNLTDVNIQKQLSAPFLLSESAGEVARFFNKTIKLDLIDTLLSAVDSKKRKNKSLLEIEKTEYERSKTGFEKLDWVEDVAELVERAEKIQLRVNEIKVKRNILVDQEDKYLELKKTYEKINMEEAEKGIIEAERIQKQLDQKRKEKIRLDRELKSYDESFVENYKYEKMKLEETEQIIIEAEKLQNELKLKRQVKMRLDRELKSYTEIKKECKQYEKINFDELKSQLKEYESLHTELKQRKQNLIYLKSDIKAYEEGSKDVSKYEVEIIRNEKLLPDICPYCKSPLKKDE